MRRVAGQDNVRQTYKTKKLTDQTTELANSNSPDGLNSSGFYSVETGVIVGTPKIKFYPDLHINSAVAGTTCYLYCRSLDICHRRRCCDCILYLMTMLHNHAIDHSSIASMLIMSLCLQDKHATLTTKRAKRNTRTKRDLPLSMRAASLSDADLLRSILVTNFLALCWIEDTKIKLVEWCKIMEAFTVNETYPSIGALVTSFHSALFNLWNKLGYRLHVSLETYDEKVLDLTSWPCSDIQYFPVC
eukprot:Platyproteum_vivax@DN1276_c0_g1_i1.p1